MKIEKRVKTMGGITVRWIRKTYSRLYRLLNTHRRCPLRKRDNRQTGYLTKQTKEHKKKITRVERQIDKQNISQKTETRGKIN